MRAATAEVEVADGEARTMALREASGRDATVRVLGADGLPLPNVSVRVELPWGEFHVQLDGGVQELGRLTDLAGRVRFTGLPEAAVTVVATLGSRSVRAKLDDESLRITLSNG